jgi:regulator of extracellular matrix RemA (YlzA/DUF370 family)
MDNHARRELYCIVENEDKAFKVIAVVDNDVADLKILVQQAKKNGTLRDADATDLVLFKVITSIEISTNTAARVFWIASPISPRRSR